MRLQNRIVELVAAADLESPFSSALLLWSTYHGLVSLRLHKPHRDWGITADDATARIVTAMVAGFANLWVPKTVSPHATC